MRAGMLSHGQKQWLEIGMLLMQDPQMLLVDEPVAGMTPQEVERTAELLFSLAGKHSVVVVEHDMNFVRSIAKKVTVLHEGHVLAEGSIDEVQGDAKVMEVYLGMNSDSECDYLEAIRSYPHVTSAPMLDIKGLNQFYSGSHILWDVNLSVPTGSCTCLMGRNGMGKTTLLKCIMGLLPTVSGEILYEGQDLRKITADRRARARHRLRAARSRDLLAAHGRGESAHRLDLRTPQAQGHSRNRSSRCFRC